MKKAMFNPKTKSVCEWAVYHLNKWWEVDPYNHAGKLPYTFDWLEAPDVH